MQELNEAYKEEEDPDKKKQIKEQLHLYHSVWEDAAWFKREATDMLVEFEYETPIKKPKKHGQKIERGKDS
jgi:hypothetical protein